MVPRKDEQELFAPGHRACPGCGEAIATRWILKATGANVIIVSPTGCLETFSSPYMFSPCQEKTSRSSLPLATGRARAVARP